MKPALLALACVFLTGCGPFLAGTWSDDPKNWKRAFEEAQPPEGIEIVHSWYTRTPHFTAEYTWYFELKLSEKAKKELASSSDLSPLSTSSIQDIDRTIYTDRPSWFSPRPIFDFDVYESKSQRGFILFIEKNGNRSFWTRSQ